MSDFKHIQDLIEVTNCQFVSFKYLGSNGKNQQFDVPAKLITDRKEYIAKEFDINLAESRAFVDPFRSVPTITVFCYKKSADNSIRATLRTLSDSTQHYNNFQASISFWVTNNELEQNDFLPMQADPYDLYANLRSEISAIADDIKINILSHHYGYSYGESVINISAENIFKLAEDILITKFIISNCAASYNFVSSFVAFNHSRNLRIMYDDMNSHKQVRYEVLVRNQIDLYKSLITFMTTAS
jgi:glutamine synthetase